MSDTIHPILCDSCGASNSSDARFCQKCGATVSIKAIKCKRCGTSNELTATFCKKCGVNLASATLGVTVERANEWWAFLNQHYVFFASIWAEKGLGQKIHNTCITFIRTKYPNIKWEHSAFTIPITSSDWCIKILEWGQRKITNGEIIGTTTDLMVFDLSNEMAWKIPYEQITSTKLDGWVYLITMTDDTTIKLHIKEYNDRSVKISSALNMATAVLSLFSSQPEGAADREARHSSTDWELQRFKENHDMGVNFWTSIHSFFAEIASHV